MGEIPKSVKARLIDKIRQAFLHFGYTQVTMTELADFCGLTRRALYHHFSSKDDAFRAVIQQAGDISIALGIAAARAAIEEGATPRDAIMTLFDARYGNARRELAASAHARDVNDTAFRLCRPIMIAQAITLHAQLCELLKDMHKRRLLTLKKSASPERVAALLADGARGVNQTLPPIPIEQLASRYGEITGAILYGAAEPPGRPGKR